ncbi:hypothetical protein D3C71_1415200 [compost metagenome]
MTGGFFYQGGQVVGIEVEMLCRGGKRAIQVMLFDVLQYFDNGDFAAGDCLWTIGVVLEHAQQLIKNQQHIGIHDFR